MEVLAFVSPQVQRPSFDCPSGRESLVLGHSGDVGPPPDPTPPGHCQFFGCQVEGTISYIVHLGCASGMKQILPLGKAFLRQDRAMAHSGPVCCPLLALWKGADSSKMTQLPVYFL